MKKLVILFAIVLFSMPVYSIDRLSQEYLENTNHISFSKGLAEFIAQRAIKKALKKETGANFDVKFEGYTTSSIRKGIFKSIELEGKDVVIDDIPVPYMHLKSLNGYNYIDYTKNPMVFKSDMTYAYDLVLSEESLNTALKDTDYLKVISKVNKIAYPIFVVKGVKTKIIDDKMYIITDYNLPIAKSKDKSFVAQSDFEVTGGKIRAKNVSISSSYGNLGLNKVANLINYLNPLDFTLSMLDSNKHNGTIENIKIVDNSIKIDGKIYIKGGQ